MLEAVTIVIPTHYRSAFRILDYYQDIDASILVVDSSNTPFPYHRQYKNVRDFYYENSSFESKMADAFQYVNSRYALLCADDDFIVPSAINLCTEFLETHPDYASAQGRYVAFRNAKQLTVWRAYPGSERFHIEAATAAERIKQHMRHYMHVFYSVHRAEHLRYFFKEMNIYFTTANVGELALSLVSSIRGKHKMLPVFYGARDGFRSPFRPYAPRLQEVLIDPEMRKEYETLLDLVAAYFCRQTGSNQVDGRRYIEQAISLYLHVPRSLRDGVFEYLKPLRDKVLKSLKPFISEIVRRFRRKVIRDIPFFDEESKKEWEVIKALILKHNGHL